MFLEQPIEGLGELNIVLENFYELTLKHAIQTDSRLKKSEIQINISLQIASAMNLLHCINPQILVKNIYNYFFLYYNFKTFNIAWRIDDFEYFD